MAAASSTLSEPSFLFEIISEAEYAGWKIAIDKSRLYTSESGGAPKPQERAHLRFRPSELYTTNGVEALCGAL